MNTTGRSAEIRRGLGHPIIDADGHLQEFTTIGRDEILDHLRVFGGPQVADRFATAPMTIEDFMLRTWMPMSEADRRDQWIPCPAWWSMPTDARDRATAHLPALMYERMDEIGVDYAILYPSLGLSAPAIAVEEVRRAACRVYNSINADLYRPYGDRLTPAAIIPMTTPEEALDELDWCVNHLGSKVVVLGHVRRPIPKVAREHVDAAPYALRLDTFGIDSDYDYDPVWKKCVELGVAATMHASEQSWGSRRSWSRYSYNHIGAFSAAGESLCKSIFMGGVTRRVPDLNFAFLEGGVGWACSLLSDMVAHWEKRNGNAIRRLDPGQLNMDDMRQLIADYCPERYRDRQEEMVSFFTREQHAPDNHDDWHRCQIEKRDDIKALFVDRFFFGCEADDPINSLAFNEKLNPFGAELHAVFGSDIGHWDVEDISAVVEEAYELVERGLLDEDQFRRLTFDNAVTLHTKTNPRFFEGTACEKAAEQVLQRAV
jgi:predicted TIM-barrel fold metal-dependent hydrolase